MATAMMQALCPVRVQVRRLHASGAARRQRRRQGYQSYQADRSPAPPLRQVKQTVAQRRVAVATRAEAGESRRQLLTGLVAGKPTHSQRPTRRARLAPLWQPRRAPAARPDAAPSAARPSTAAVRSPAAG
jgi:hypothetical protein